MKLKDILNEMPSMVPQSGYPFDKQSQNSLDAATANPNQFIEKYNDGEISIRESRADPNSLRMFSGDQAIGHMILSDTGMSKQVGAQVWQVSDVWINPEYRNKGLGKKFYNYVLKERKEGFASVAAMTPSSRRIYTSMLDDPSVTVFGILRQHRNSEFESVQLHKGENGITTGASDIPVHTAVIPPGN